MKKAQITIFVIIGLVLLLIAALFIIAKKTTVEDKPPQSIITHDFSSVIATYRAGAERCLEQEGALIFQQLFSQGGYADPPTAGFTAIDAYPTRGSAVKLSHNTIIPYWLEHKASATCRQGCPVSFHIPPLTKNDGSNSIEEQAEQLINQRITTCLDAITFPQDYDVSIQGEPRVTITIGETTITYELERPLTITHIPTGATTTITTVTAQSTANAKILYDMGVALLQQMEISNLTRTFGELTKTLIHAYSMTGELPPINGEADFTLSPAKMWLLPDVKEKLTTLLADNIPLVTIRRTKNDRLFVDENRYSQVIYNNPPFAPDIIIPHQEYLPRTSIDFLYLPTWEPDLNIEPSSGYLIRPTSIQFLNIPLLQLGYTDYQFSYDIIYPVIVILRDDESFEGEGLTLMYAFETGLRLNQPLAYEDLDVTEKTHDDLFSSDEQRMNGIITITTQNGMTGEPLPNVTLTYVCGEDTTTAGTTTMVNNKAISVTTLPQCIGGYITATLTGYYSNPAPLTIIGDENHDVTINLYPYKEFKLRVRTRLLTKSTIMEDLSPVTTWQLGTTDNYIGADDTVMYVFTKNTLPGEQEHIETGIINLTNEATATVKLIPGEYDVEAYLITSFGEGHAKMKHVIPEAEIEYDEDPLNPFAGKKTITIPAVEFNETIPLGGISLTRTAGTQLVITNDDYQHNTLTLKLIKIRLEDLTTHEDLEQLGKIEEYSTSYHDQLRPEFTNT